jgi:hypothetical protein
MANNSPTASMVLPKAGLNGIDGTFLQSSTLGFLLSFSTKIPRLRQYPKRCAAYKTDNLMILKKYICTLFVLSSLCLSCKSDYEKEVEKSKTLTTFLRTEELPSYDSMYNQIIGGRTNPTSQDLLIDSLFQTTKKVTILIDSLIIEVERIDSTGENRKVGNPLLVDSPAGLKLTKGAKAIQQYCLELINDDKKKNILNQQFLKYKGYLGSTVFNDIYFSQSSTSFILMILVGLKNDLIKATYFALAGQDESVTKLYDHTTRGPVQVGQTESKSAFVLLSSTIQADQKL